MNLWKAPVAVVETTRPEEKSCKPPANDPSVRAGDLCRLLTSVTEKPVRLTITDNRRSMMTSRLQHGSLFVRLHHMFLSAPAQVWDALALFLAQHDTKAAQVVDAYIESNMHLVRGGGGGHQPVGRVHDLQLIFDRLNQMYFHGACLATVTWGRAGSRSYRRTIQLGCYVPDDDLIRMHPSLDQAFVPEFYVSWVMFHEMLHEAFGIEEKNGRRHIHPPAFVALEQSYPDYERAKSWEQRNIHRLLRYRAG